MFRAAGTLSALANGLGVTVQSISGWKDIPPERCLDVEKLTGISRYDLRPDIYGEPPQESAA